MRSFDYQKFIHDIMDEKVIFNQMLLHIMSHASFDADPKSRIDITTDQERKFLWIVKLIDKG